MDHSRSLDKGQLQTQPREHEKGDLHGSGMGGNTRGSVHMNQGMTGTTHHDTGGKGRTGKE